MRHISDHFMDYGGVAWGTNDINETIHKYTKQAYILTMKNINIFPPQLIAIRISNSFSIKDDCEYGVDGSDEESTHNNSTCSEHFQCNIFKLMLTSYIAKSQYLLNVNEKLE